MRLLYERLGLTRAFYFRIERDKDGWVHVIEANTAGIRLNRP